MALKTCICYLSEQTELRGLLFQQPLTYYQIPQSERAALSGHLSRDHALRYPNPLAYCTATFLARYYAVYKNWHRIRVALPAPWSYDWRRWKDGPNLSGIVKYNVSHLYGVSATVEPLAFYATGLSGCEGPVFLFFAGGEYYFYEIGGLMRFEEHFTSHEDFLRRFEVHLGTGTEMPNVWHPEPEQTGQEVADREDFLRRSEGYLDSGAEMPNVWHPEQTSLVFAKTRNEIDFRPVP
ncbi:hypothetical protein K438DRAFT_1780833 [Mycena galopus ATCC 62051]|nr:hypothetical protein K438DRAFT_1780833 [Mycena galopus ATCC 62051]